MAIVLLLIRRFNGTCLSRHHHRWGNMAELDPPSCNFFFWTIPTFTLQLSMIKARLSSRRKTHFALTDCAATRPVRAWYGTRTTQTHHPSGSQVCRRPSFSRKQKHVLEVPTLLNKHDMTCRVRERERRVGLAFVFCLSASSSSGRGLIAC